MDLKVKIEDLTENKIDETIALMDSMVGEGLYTRNLLEESIKNDKHFFKIICEEEKVVAYCYYIIMSAGEYKDLLTETKPSKFLYSLGDDVMICAMQSIGIINRDRGHNVSDILVESGLSIAKKLKCEFAIVYAWEYNGNVPAKSLLKRCGFRHEETIDRAWEKIETLKCDKCGGNTCCCSARVFVRKF